MSTDGYLAVLTNYRETDFQDAKHPIHGVKSRGGMVTAWLGGSPDETVKEAVQRLVKDDGVKGVGGFSMVCGKLRKDTQGIAIVSNRAGDVEEVPIVAKERGEIWALSNAVFDLEDSPKEWPKIKLGKQLVKEAIEASVSEKGDQEDLMNRLFSALDTDTLPPHDPNMSFVDYINQLKHSIFIPAIGDEAHRQAMEEAMARGPGEWATDEQKAVEELMSEGRPEPSATPVMGFETGMYGTQRQTLILVDWDGNVTFKERALWDGNGNAIPRGDGDVEFKFKIDGWEGDKPLTNGMSNGVHE